LLASFEWGAIGVAGCGALERNPSNSAQLECVLGGFSDEEPLELRAHGLLSLWKIPAKLGKTGTNSCSA
jgi:hypothetical protein